MLFQDEISFAIPATTATFAPEVLYIGGTSGAAVLAFVLSLFAQVTQVVAASELVFEILRPGLDDTVSANWIEHSLFTGAALGKTAITDLAGATVRVRGRSGGTSGTLRASVAADLSDKVGLLASSKLNPLA